MFFFAKLVNIIKMKARCYKSKS